MRLQEFKAWFEGYTEAMKGAPTEKQWTRIKEQVKKIDGTWYYYNYWPQNYWHYSTPTSPTVTWSHTSVDNQGYANTTSATSNEMCMSAAYTAGQTDAKEAT